MDGDQACCEAGGQQERWTHEEEEPSPHDELIMTEIRRRWSRRFVRGVMAYLPGVIFALVLAEMALRIMGLGDPAQARGHREEEQRLFGDLSNGAYEPGSRLVYTYPGNPRGYFDANNQVVGSINQYGYRGPARAPYERPVGPRLAVLGDSFTLGYGLRDEDTFPAQLEKFLRVRHPETEVLNFGVAAFGTRTEVDYLQGYVLKFHPDVVLLCLFLNDAGREGTRGFLSPGGGRWWPARRYSYLLNLTLTQVRRYRVGRELIHHYRRGYEPDSEAWQEVQAELLRARDLCRENDCRLILLVYPVLYRLDDYPFRQVHLNIGSFAAYADIPFIDLLPAFKGATASHLWNHATDQHPNRQAQRRVGEWLAEQLEPWMTARSGGSAHDPVP